MQYVFGILMFLTSLFLILLILVQRGRGGGLAGAFGGMGGQSAFGTKAGDLFTRITIGVAALWIVLSVGAIKVLNQSQSVFGETSRSSFADPKSKTPVTPPSESVPSGTAGDKSTTSPTATTPSAPAPSAPAATTPSAPAPSAPAATTPAPTPSASGSAGAKAEAEAKVKTPATPSATDKK